MITKALSVCPVKALWVGFKPNRCAGPDHPGLVKDQKVGAMDGGWLRWAYFGDANCVHYVVLLILGFTLRNRKM